MNDAQVKALQAVIDRREQWTQSVIDLDNAIVAALDAGVSLREVGESSGFTHSTIQRRYVARRRPRKAST